MNGFRSIGISAVVGTIALSAWAAHSLPGTVPVHFGPDGTVDRFGSRWEVLLLAPVILVVTAAIYLWKERPANRARDLVFALTSSTMLALHFVMLRLARGGEESVLAGRADLTPVTAILAVLWILLALVMPRIPRNHWVGVRVPWTLTSDEVWAKTHRFASYTFALGAVVAVTFLAFHRASNGMTALVVGALLPIVYAFNIRERIPTTPAK